MCGAGRSHEQALRCVRFFLPPLVLQDLIFSLTLKAKSRNLLVWEGRAVSPKLGKDVNPFVLSTS